MTEAAAVTPTKAIATEKDKVKSDDTLFAEAKQRIKRLQVRSQFLTMKKS